MADYGSELIAKGAAYRLVMPMSATFSAGVSAGERVFCRPPQIETLSAVCAGDSMVAAITSELSLGGNFRDAVRYGVAAAGSAVLTPATELCSNTTADEILGQVATEEI